ncbi:MAG: hypothetical protein LC624_07965, partial [Halobacteriales archaeon]|nr:hypothetical protein [Halobacteriales archaeon]
MSLAEDDLVAPPAGAADAPRQRLADRDRKLYEVALVAALGSGTALLVLGGLLASVAGDAQYRWGAGAMALGMALTALSLALSRPIWRLRVLLRRSSGGMRYDQLKHWTRFKAAVILANLLTGLAVLILGLSLVHRFGPFELAGPIHLEIRLATLFSLILGVCLAATHWLSLRTPVERPETPAMLGLFFALAIALTLAFAMVGAVLASRPLDLGSVRLLDTDAPFFLLASIASASLSLFLGRSIPNLVAIVTRERSYYAGHTYLSRNKSILMPAMMAFALLFLVVLVLLVFGVGYTGLFTEIPRNALLIGVFGFIVAALAASVVAALLLSRSEDRATLYHVRRSAEARLSLLILGTSLGIAGLLFGLSAWLATGHRLAGLDPMRWLDFLAFGIMAAVGPYGFYAANAHRRVKRLEERFPDLLRDLAASRKAGLTLTSS